MFYSERYLMAQHQQEETHEDTQALWLLKEVGTPGMDEMEQLQAEIWTGAFTSKLLCVLPKTQMLTDLFKEDLLQCLENRNWSQHQAATARVGNNSVLSFVNAFAASAHFARHIRESSAISFPTWSPNLRRPEQPKAKSWPSSLCPPRQTMCKLTSLVFG